MLTQLCRHMASLGHNELSWVCWIYSMNYYQFVSIMVGIFKLLDNWMIKSFPAVCGNISCCNIQTVIYDLLPLFHHCFPCHVITCHITTRPCCIIIKLWSRIYFRYSITVFHVMLSLAVLQQDRAVSLSNCDLKSTSVIPPLFSMSCYYLPYYNKTVLYHYQTVI